MSIAPAMNVLTGVTENATGDDAAAADDLKSVRHLVDDGYYSMIGLTELLVCVVGVPLNIFVLLMTCVQRRPLRKSGRSVTETLIISMSLADLLFCGVHSPVMFANYFLHYSLQKYPCEFLYIVTHVSTIASSLSLLWLNMNKFVQLRKPLHYFLYITKRRALTFILFSWAVSLIWGVLFVVGPFLNYGPHCSAAVKSKVWYVFFAVEFFLLPTLISLMVSVQTAYVVLNERRFGTRFDRLTGGDWPNGNASTAGAAAAGPVNKDQHRLPDCSRYSKRFRGSSLRQIGFVFTTTVWTAFTVVPYRLAFIVNATTSPDETLDAGGRVSLCLFALLTLNAAGNPLITLLSHKQYSVKCRYCLGKLFRCFTSRPPRRRRPPPADDRQKTSHCSLHRSVRDLEFRRI